MRNFGCIVVFAILGMFAGCKQHENGEPSATRTVTLIREAEGSKGGPRVMSYYKSGRIEETLEEKYKSLTPGYLETTGVRISGDGAVSTGVMVFANNSTFSGDTDLKFTVLYLDSAEVPELKAAFAKEASYLSGVSARPPQHQEAMVWRSLEGLQLGASVESGNPGFYFMSPEAFGKKSFGLKLSQESAKGFVNKVEAALNLAEEGK